MFTPGIFTGQLFFLFKIDKEKRRFIIFLNLTSSIPRSQKSSTADKISDLGNLPLSCNTSMSSSDSNISATAAIKLN